MVPIKEFMEKNNLVFLVEVDANEKMFHIYKTDKELESYVLFEQLILFSNTEKYYKVFVDNFYLEFGPKEIPNV